MKTITALLVFLAMGRGSFSQTMQPRLNHLAIYVKDLHSSDSFYRKVMGLDTIPEPFHDGKHRWLAIGPGQSLHIIEGANEVRAYFKNNHICFSVPSVAAFTQSLKKYGGAWEDVSGNRFSITVRVDGVNQIWLQDPDGYWIEINDAK